MKARESVGNDGEISNEGLYLVRYWSLGEIKKEKGVTRELRLR